MTPWPFLAAAAALVLVPAPRVRHEIPGFPRIGAPDAAGRRINAALDRLDARVRVAARDCLAERTVNPPGWERTVAVPMRGPEFVSYAVTDEVDCGGMYPYEVHSAIVYDLRTGGPVDWRAMLPARLTGTLALNEGADQVKVVTLSSRRLSALYAARYDPRRTGAPKDCVGLPDDDDGTSAATPMLAWLDAKAGGLALQFDLNHAMQACSEAVVLPIAVLRREGASPRLLAALTAAHAAVAERPRR